eukprot:403367464
MFNTSITNSQALIGGAISLMCGKIQSCKYTIRNNIFRDNLAIDQGGAIYYSKYRPDFMLDNQYINNLAVYGQNYASFPYSVQLLKYDQIEVASGQKYNGQIEVALIDPDVKDNLEQCQDCLDHTICPGGYLIDVNQGYWRKSFFDTQIHKCIEASACIGGMYSLNNQEDKSNYPLCAEGYEGNLCNRCQIKGDKIYSRSGIISSTSLIDLQWPETLKSFYRAFSILGETSRQRLLISRYAGRMLDRRPFKIQFCNWDAIYDILGIFNTNNSFWSFIKKQKQTLATLVQTKISDAIFRIEGRVLLLGIHQYLSQSVSSCSKYIPSNTSRFFQSAFNFDDYHHAICSASQALAIQKSSNQHIRIKRISMLDKKEYIKQQSDLQKSNQSHFSNKDQEIQTVQIRLNLKAPESNLNINLRSPVREKKAVKVVNQSSKETNSMSEIFSSNQSNYAQNNKRQQKSSKNDQKMNFGSIKGDSNVSTMTKMHQKQSYPQTSPRANDRKQIYLVNHNQYKTGVEIVELPDKQCSEQRQILSKSEKAKNIPKAINKQNKRIYFNQSAYGTNNLFSSNNEFMSFYNKKQKNDQQLNSSQKMELSQSTKQDKTNKSLRNTRVNQIIQKYSTHQSSTNNKLKMSPIKQANKIDVHRIKSKIITIEENDLED